MNNLKANTFGIDKVIQDIQSKIYARLEFDNIEGYGRVYTILNKENKTIPAHFIGGEDYKDVLFSDINQSGNFFFYEESNSKKVNGSEYESKVHLVFQLNLTKIKQGIDYRNDEEIRAEIEKALFGQTRFVIEEFTRGIDALKDFDNDLRDMQPYCFFRFSGKMRYQLNC